MRDPITGFWHYPNPQTIQKFKGRFQEASPRSKNRPYFLPMSSPKERVEVEIIYED